ncbi:TLDc domain-containing protein [Entamoeba marina]
MKRPGPDIREIRRKILIGDTSYIFGGKDQTYHDFEKQSIRNIETLIAWFKDSNDKYRDMNDEPLVMYDSDIDGSSKEDFIRCVKNKKNLIFVSLDNNNNVFGGYVSTLINGTDIWINDTKTCLFRLFRNGKSTIKRYELNVLPHNSSFSFWLFQNGRYNDQLYQFGYGDLVISKVNTYSSRCKQHSFNYLGEDDIFVDEIHENGFLITRILVLEL